MRYPLPILMIAILGMSAAPLLAQQAPETAYPWEGEVTGSNVFVRSGAGNNWYPTTKLNTGDRVLVLGEKFGWYQITPPADSFSYIDMSMVERKGGSKSGTVKQDKVYVRAGSKLEQRRNSTQVVLNKGDTVDILGESDGFYKINPPAGATLFISKQYVRPVDTKLRSGLAERHVNTKLTETPNQKPGASETGSGAIPDGATPRTGISSESDVMTSDTMGTDRIPIPADTEPPSEPDAASYKAVVDPNADQPSQAAPKTEQSPAKSATGSASNKVTRGDQSARSEPAPTAPPVTGRYKAMLTMVEGELADMMRRPLEDQNPMELVKRYESIAGQSEESIPAQVAAIRMRQLRDRASLKESHVALAKDNREIEELRANMDKERVRIMNQRVLKAMERYDLEGELRESFAFASENRRYRLVDPQSKVTIAYVDIPVSVQTNPQHLIGQLVGIKSSGKRFSPAARVPIAVAEEVVDLSPRKLPDGGLRISPPSDEAADSPIENDATLEEAGHGRPRADAGDRLDPGQ